jgi:hypothetical protein
VRAPGLPDAYGALARRLPDCRDIQEHDVLRGTVHGFPCRGAENCCLTHLCPTSASHSNLSHGDLSRIPTRGGGLPWLCATPVGVRRTSRAKTSGVPGLRPGAPAPMHHPDACLDATDVSGSGNGPWRPTHLRQMRDKGVKGAFLQYTDAVQALVQALQFPLCERV